MANPYSEFEKVDPKAIASSGGASNSDPYSEFQSVRQPPPKPEESKPTDRVNRFMSGLSGGISDIAPRFMDHPLDTAGEVAGAIGNNLGRTTQAWHDVFTGHPNATNVAEMVPVVGPAAVDAGKRWAQGDRAGAVGAGLNLVAPAVAHSGVPGLGGSPLNLAEGDVPTPSVPSRIISGVKAGAPDVAKGIGKAAGGIAIDAATPYPANVGAAIVTAPMIRSGIKQAGRGFSAGVNEFRGPVYGPETAPAAAPNAPSPSVGTVTPPTTVLPSGVARIGVTPAERIGNVAASNEGTVGTRAELMRQLRLADQHGTTAPGKAAIIRRFESSEYTPREARQ